MHTARAGWPDAGIRTATMWISLPIGWFLRAIMPVILDRSYAMLHRRQAADVSISECYPKKIGLWKTQPGPQDSCTAELRSFQEDDGREGFSREIRRTPFLAFLASTRISVFLFMQIESLGQDQALCDTDDSDYLSCGCGRGAWSRLMLHAKALFCVECPFRGTQWSALPI